MVRVANLEKHENLTKQTPTTPVTPGPSCQGFGFKGIQNGADATPGMERRIVLGSKICSHQRKIKPIERSLCCLVHIIINVWSVQMVNLSKGASSNGDIRAWLVYCARPTTATSTRIWQPKKCRARPWRLQQQARLPFWQTSQQHAVNTPLHPTMRADASSTLLSLCVFVHANQSFSEKNVGWTERLSFLSPSSLSFCSRQEMPLTFPHVRFEQSRSLAENGGRMTTVIFWKSHSPSIKGWKTNKNVEIRSACDYFNPLCKTLQFTKKKV